MDLWIKRKRITVSVHDKQSDRYVNKTKVTVSPPLCLGSSEVGSVKIKIREKTVGGPLGPFPPYKTKIDTTHVGTGGRTRVPLPLSY